MCTGLLLVLVVHQGHQLIRMEAAGCVPHVFVVVVDVNELARIFGGRQLELSASNTRVIIAIIIIVVVVVVMRPELIGKVLFRCRFGFGRPPNGEIPLIKQSQC